MLIRWLECLAERRLPDGERHRQSAFRADIETSWRPATRAARQLAIRSRLTYVWHNLTTGGPTLAQVGIAAGLTTLGAIALTIAPTPNTPEYASEPVLVFSILLSVGVLGLAIEGLRSPRSISRRRFICLVAAPLAIGTLGSAATMRIELAPDRVLLVALIVGGVGNSFALVSAALRSDTWLRRSLVLIGLSATGIVVSDAWWAPIFTADGDPSHAIACVISALGSALMANGLLRARPSLT